MTDNLRDVVVSLVRQDSRDLTLRQLAILLKARTSPEAPYTVRRFAADLDIKKPAVTRAITRLIKMGLVSKRQDPTDGRSVLIRLTVGGVAYADGIRAARL